MSNLIAELESLAAQQKKLINNKGGLCLGLVMTKTARERGLPLDPESLRTAEEGQVAGMGGAAVQSILSTYEPSSFMRTAKVG